MINMTESTLREILKKSGFDVKNVNNPKGILPKVDFPTGSAGGIVTQKSSCCGASVVYTPGGIQMPICSGCGKPYVEPRYGVVI